MGYCKTNVFWNSEACCTARKPLVSWDITGESCEAWHTWTFRYWGAYGIYVGFAPLFGIIAASATMLTKRALPAAAPGHDHKNDNVTAGGPQGVVGKTMYMAAGSGIPEIETILSGLLFRTSSISKFLQSRHSGQPSRLRLACVLRKKGRLCTFRPASHIWWACPCQTTVTMDGDERAA
ncbi:Chloride channel, core [Lasallia pustulata]|uniref:Chloride channel, core n=1 Tax=Lasallia pustulata TaxID=136370 RepID=A0A1W5D2C1_9LECA|nr:Chloride channel, core [Lasallia pustulata]